MPRLQRLSDSQTPAPPPRSADGGIGRVEGPADRTAATSRGTSAGNPSDGDRRAFLGRCAWLATAAAGASGPSLASVGLAAETQAGRGGRAAPTQLTADPRLDLFRVRLEMDVQGNVNVPGDPLVSRKKRTQLPIEGKTMFDYEERLRRPPGATPDSIPTAAERFYHEAWSDSRIDRKRLRVELRDPLRRVIVRRDVLPETVYAIADYLTHQELDLMRVPASSVAADRLLPAQPVSVGDTYQVSGRTLGSLLNLTAVETDDVTVEVVEVGESKAKFKLRGDLEGSVEGVPTTIRALGKMTFDRSRRAVTWLALALHETREIGKAEPGFDVSATIKLVRQPLRQPAKLPSEKPTLALTEPIPADRLLVELSSREVGFRVLMDRRWRMMRDVPGSAMMRMIDNDRSIAQCNVRPLARLPEGKQWTLEAFQQDVARTIGNRLSRLVEADRRVSDAGLRVLRVTAHGEVEGVPIQWVMLHFSDDSGRRLLATFTLDVQSVEKFAGADVQLANSLQFSADVGDSPEQDASPAGVGELTDGERTESRAEDVARANRPARQQVESASDLK